MISAFAHHFPSQSKAKFIINQKEQKQYAKA